MYETLLVYLTFTAQLAFHIPSSCILHPCVFSQPPVQKTPHRPKVNYGLFIRSS